MISRLVVSLRKVVDTSIIRVWDGDHFTSVESGEHEMMDFADAPPPLTPFPPFSRQDSERSSRPHPPNFYSEA